MSNFETRGETGGVAAVDTHELLGNVITQTEKDREAAREALEGLAALDPVPLAGDDVDLDALLDETIAERRAARNAMIDAVLHHPRVNIPVGKRLAIEATVCDPDRDEENVPVLLLPATKRDVRKDFASARGDFQETYIFRALVRERFGVAGGGPILCLATDITIGPGADDMALADGLTRVAARGFMPVIAQASAAFLRADTWATLPRSRAELEQRWKTRENDAYRAFRGKPHARFLTLTMLDLACRQPFGHGTAAEDLDDYVETLRSPDELTRAPVPFHVARLIAVSQSRHNWPCLVGENYGGRIDGLYSLRDPLGRWSCPTSFPVDDLLEMFFQETCGFLAPVHVQGTNTAVLYGAPTVQRILRGEARDLADLACNAKLPNLLVHSRFGHLIKVIMRSLIGAGMGPAEVEAFLQRWADQFVSAAEKLSESDQAKYPFRDIRISVKSVPGNDGVLEATVILVPRFRVASITATLLVYSDDGATPEQRLAS